MHKADLVGLSQRRESTLATRRWRAALHARDLADHNLPAEASSQIWAGNIIFGPAALGFLYLVVVIGIRSWRVVGLSFANDLWTTCVFDAVETAVIERQPCDLIHHSDQESQ